MKKILFLFAISFGYIINGYSQTNILFIESDDQSNQALGTYGNKAMITPNIDKLASEGVSFTSA